ncbi:MAG: hypothetical protein V1875_05940 [Candidatus Altiarchaeota archaeon]
MPSDEEFSERAKTVVGLAGRLGRALLEGTVPARKSEEYQELLHERVASLKRLELESLDDKILGFSVSRDELDNQRTSGNISDDAYLTLADGLNRQKQELDSQKKAVAGLGEKDYLARIMSRYTPPEETEQKKRVSKPDKADEAPAKPSPVSAIMNREKIGDELAYVVLALIVIAGLKYALSSGLFPKNTIPYAVSGLSIVTGILCLYASTSVMHVGRASMKNAFFAFFAIFLLSSVAGFAASGTKHASTVMFLAYIVSSVIILGRVYFLPFTESLTVAMAYFIPYLIVLWALGISSSPI